MIARNTTLVVVGTLIALINWAGAAHADPAPPAPTPAPVEIPAPPSGTTAPPPPPDGSVTINAPGDYEDSGSGIGDINLSLF